MASRRFYLGIVARVLLIVVCSIIIAVTGLSAKYTHTIIVALIVILFLTLNMIRYVNRTNRQLAVFFHGLRGSYDNLVLSKGEADSSYGKLLKSMQDAWDLIQEARIEKEKDHLFLKHIVENIGNGIIAYNSEGEVLLANQAFTGMFGFSELNHINSLKKVNREVWKQLSEPGPWSKSYVKTVAEGSLLELLIYVSTFKFRDEVVHLASFQNINEKLNQKEIDAWQSIIRVLSHEIMSSFSPITSLSDHLSSELSIKMGEDSQLLDNTDFMQDLHKGLEIIAGRSNGIMEFVRKYRMITAPLQPQFKKTDISSLAQNVSILAEREFEGLRIDCQVLEKKLIEIDPGLIEQSILNIVRNSYQSMEGKREKQLSITSEERPVDFILSITDYGKGIDEDVIENVFVPFFTTRKGGSGIGLSFTRQVMVLHGGDVKLSSLKGKGTTVSLIFPKKLKV